MNCTQRVKKLYAVKHLLGEFLPVGRRKNELRNITHAKFNQRKYGQLPCDKCHSKPYPVSCHKCGSSGYIDKFYLLRKPAVRRRLKRVSQPCWFCGGTRWVTDKNGDRRFCYCGDGRVYF